MPISESQLEAWSHQGATGASETTHQSIRAALKAHTWPTGMTYRAYLQGSYPNFTNIRGNSDVDLVVESSAVFYSNLTNAEKQAKALSPGAFTWSDFRDEVERALVAYYGRPSVQAFNKSIKVAPSSNRLPADVVPAVEYQEYQQSNLSAVGMTFWTRDNRQIINFPKLHLENGATKNSPTRVNGWYRPTIRMFKNAREKIINGDDKIRKQYPSYFVECLVYNADDRCFGDSYQATYAAVVNELNSGLSNSKHEAYVCQNEQRHLFGTSSVQWSVENARRFIDELIALWNRS